MKGKFVKKPPLTSTQRGKKRRDALIAAGLKEVRNLHVHTDQWDNRDLVYVVADILNGETVAESDIRRIQSLLADAESRL